MPIVISIPDNIDLDNASFQIDRWSGSVTVTPGSAGRPPQFGDGNIRIWNKDGDEARSANSLHFGGNLVLDSMSYTATQLGFTEEIRTITLYVEGHTVSSSLGNREIIVRMEYEFNNETFLAEDKVKYTVKGNDFGLLIDSNNDGVITQTDDTIEENSPGKLIQVSKTAEVEHRVPMIFELPREDYETSGVRIQLNFPNHLAIFTEETGGTQIVSGEWYGKDQIGQLEANGIIYLYVGATGFSQENVQDYIEVIADPDGLGPESAISDKVAVTAIQFPEFVSDVDENVDPNVLPVEINDDHYDATLPFKAKADIIITTNVPIKAVATREIKYELVSQIMWGTNPVEPELFTIDEDTGEIKLLRDMDEYSLVPLYDLLVRAYYVELPEFYDETTVSVNILPEVGIAGDFCGIEGTNDQIEFYFARRGPLTETKVRFTINWYSDTVDGIAESDFEPEDILALEALRVSTSGSIKTYEVTIPAGFTGDSISQTIRLRAISDNVPQEVDKIFESLSIRVISYDECGYNVVDTGDSFYDSQGNLVLSYYIMHIFEGVTLFGNRNIAGNLEDKDSTGNYIEPGIHMNDIRQVNFGNCYFQAVLMAIADHDPGWIRSHLSENDGVFSVKLYDTLSQETTFTYDVMQNNIMSWQYASFESNCDYNNATKNAEIWPQLYEMAFADYYGNGLPEDYYGRLTTEAVTRITGKLATTTDLSGKTVQECQTTIDQMFDDGEIVWIGTHLDIKTQIGDVVGNIVENHVYYLKKTGETTYTMYNPWGYDNSHIRNITADTLKTILDHSDVTHVAW